jgi:tRNA(Ile2) C34 agmatinyltransferase TiaS
MLTLQETEHAKAVVAATEWSGDCRVNLTSALAAGRVLARRIEELEQMAEYTEVPTCPACRKQYKCEGRSRGVLCACELPFYAELTAYQNTGLTFS